MGLVVRHRIEFGSARFPPRPLGLSVYLLGHIGRIALRWVSYSLTSKAEREAKYGRQGKVSKRSLSNLVISATGSWLLRLCLCCAVSECCNGDDLVTRFQAAIVKVAVLPIREVVST
jgi:hypothetical protein